jgi:hypothetical protein
MADSAEALHHPGQGGEESLPVFVVAIDFLACIAARADMIDGAGEFDSERTGRGASLPN